MDQMGEVLHYLTLHAGFGSKTAKPLLWFGLMQEKFCGSGKHAISTPSGWWNWAHGNWQYIPCSIFHS